MAICAVCATRAAAHPGSGIVVDPRGQVFFQDSVGRVVWKIDAQGKLTPFFRGKGGHWMCLDTAGSFARAYPKMRFERITPFGDTPALIFADGGAPIVVNRDGNLYYGSGFPGGDDMSPGGATVTRMTPDGKCSVFAPELKKALEKIEDGVTGLAAGPDGSLYIACATAVLKVTMDGTVTTLAHPVVVPDCDRDEGARTPYLRGLEIDSRGTVYAAATGCGCVVKITHDGRVETILKAERPWSPTGVALHGGNVYVLEYTHANGGPQDGWLPRIRKLGRDGKITTLATISGQESARQPR
jgi:sugar lactone lactonase YvrE